MGRKWRYSALGFSLSMVLAMVLAKPVLAQTPAALPAAIQADGASTILTVYAEGAQVYECKADTGGKLVWTFREPVATLLQDGKTIGRHYAGPHWELTDGSIVQGKVIGRAPGAAASDIPLLKLEVFSRKGQGLLTQATIIQRINTKGGMLDGACETAGIYRSIAYSTDYVFLKQ
jgi:Protein of unknown function (DUF3455)